MSIEFARKQKQTQLAQPPEGWRRVWDTYAGQWQQDVEVQTDAVLSYSAVFACIRLISSDIGKLRLKLMQRTSSGVWQEFENAAHSPVLRKPNPYQTRIKFLEQWITTKLIHGRAPILKSRDARGVVRELRVLDATMVDPLVSESGAVFFRLRQNMLASIDEEVIVPAREMIYDVHVAPEHPLIGVSPIGACGLAATQGLRIQKNSAKFFGNMSRPSFVLSTPGAISDQTAARIKTQWEQNFGGDNYGKTAILGDGLEPKAFSISAEDSQLIAQLGWTGEDVCRAFGVPSYKIGFGALPAFNNVEALDQAYYSQCLQEFIECVEVLLDEGLELPAEYGVELDLDGLLRMDSKTRAEVDGAEVGAGILSPNEARAKRNLMPVTGGASPYLQQQNYSLSALAKRDAQADPFATAKPAVPAAEEEPEPEDDEADDEPEENEDVSAEDVQRHFRELARAIMEAA
jgi:HK97 family phage portal protein